ncbi:MAG: DUF364 domain-containing protein [Deferribacterota bacterium]|nr:DUF364 domain-containing protein [Deferribacterota bacterium]
MVMKDCFEFYNNLINTFKEYIDGKIPLDSEIKISCRVLDPNEAIGNPKRKDFPLLNGKEVLIEADFNGFKGQAYTDSPAIFNGTISEVLNLDLEKNSSKAILVATINAVVRFLEQSIKTVHCKDEEPTECAKKISEFLRGKDYKKILLIGYQPAIADALNEDFELIVLDRNKDNVGKNINNLVIYDGYKDSGHLFGKVDIILSTGSTIANGSIADILQNAKAYKKDIYFYGTTIAGAAHLLKLNRLCFEAH